MRLMEADSLITKYSDWYAEEVVLEQIEIRRFLTDEEWNRFYQGDEGMSTFFLNLAEGEIYFLLYIQKGAEDDEY